MKFQNSIIVTALVSFVCAAPFVEGRDDKAVVSNNSEHLESGSTNFENVEFVPRSVLRKREVEAGNEAAQAVGDLYGNLVSMYNQGLHWSDLESKIVDVVKEFERVQELLKTAPVGDLEEKFGYVAKMIDANKEIIEMDKRFDGCDYPGSNLVEDLLDLKLFALTAGSLQGNYRANRIADLEKELQGYQDSRAKEGEGEMVPGLQKVFAAQAEKVNEIIRDLKKDKRSDKDLSSGTDAARDDKKTCPEIV